MAGIICPNEHEFELTGTITDGVVYNCPFCMSEGRKPCTFELPEHLRPRGGGGLAHAIEVRYMQAASPADAPEAHGQNPFALSADEADEIAERAKDAKESGNLDTQAGPQLMRLAEKLGRPAKELLAELREKGVALKSPFSRVPQAVADELLAGVPA